MSEDIKLIYCPRCGFQFKHIFSSEGKKIGRTSGFVAGAILGSKVGIAMGPLGAIAGTIPGAFIGGVFGQGLGKNIDKAHCPKCGQKFEIPLYASTIIIGNQNNKIDDESSKKSKNEIPSTILELMDKNDFFKIAEELNNVRKNGNEKKANSILDEIKKINNELYMSVLRIYDEFKK